MEYQWLVNFSLYAALVYLTTEIYSIYSPIENEINLSMLWCSIVIVFALYPFVEYVNTNIKSFNYNIL